ncbi:hypothetical protein BGW41_006327 [Actinomortierella wolfii]|nr:hypothetical protein BGW41_006327 [Actinomortierella wolfii]
MTAKVFLEAGASAALSVDKRLAEELPSREQDSCVQSSNSTSKMIQAQKFSKGEVRREIAASLTPREAFDTARSKSDSFKTYWDHQCRCGSIYKERVMVEGLLNKFSEKKPLARYSLLATGTCELVEDSDKDGYWGVGQSGKGLNRLGYLLELLS